MSRHEKSECVSRATFVGLNLKFQFLVQVQVQVLVQLWIVFTGTALLHKKWWQHRGHFLLLSVWTTFTDTLSGKRWYCNIIIPLVMQTKCHGGGGALFGLNIGYFWRHNTISLTHKVHRGRAKTSRTFLKFYFCKKEQVLSSGNVSHTSTFML